MPLMKILNNTLSMSICKRVPHIENRRAMVLMKWELSSKFVIR